MKFNIFLSWCLGWMVITGALAQTPSQRSTAATFPVLTLSASPPDRLEIGTRMGVLTDATRTLTLAQVLAADQGWQAITQAAPNFGFTHDAHWFRFQLDNPTGQALTRFIELPIPFLNSVSLYHFGQGQLITQHDLGNAKPFAQRPVRHQNFVMPVTLAPGLNPIYLRLASSGTIEATLRVWNPVYFQARNSDEKLLQGLVVGILLIMVIYNLFVFFFTGDINYFYYVGFVASYLLFHLTLTGYTFAYVWPQALQWNSYAISTFIASSALFTCLFTEHFLKLESFSKTAFYLVRGLALCSALLLLLTFWLPYNITVRVGAAMTMPIAITALVLGYWRWWRGAKFARFYCLAWTAMLASLMLLNAGKFGLIPTSVWTENASELGAVLLVVLLSLTLADRINHDRTLRLNAQNRALEHERHARASQLALIKAQEAANHELEQRVQARTMDLNQTLRELKVANDRLQQLSTTDGLTQISNRAFFDQSLVTEHQRASRLRVPLTLIMFDIDHFKHINDTQGHPAGDACLRALAGLMRSKIQRATDVLARYGGEEFVVLLFDTPLAQALDMAEGFRVAIAQLSVDFNHTVIHFTASLGVASVVPGNTDNPQHLLAAADKALYQAKQDGRNCVRAAG